MIRKSRDAMPGACYRDSTTRRGIIGREGPRRRTVVRFFRFFLAREAESGYIGISKRACDMNRTPLILTIAIVVAVTAAPPALSASKKTPDRPTVAPAAQPSSTNTKPQPINSGSVDRTSPGTVKNVVSVPKDSSTVDAKQRISWPIPESWDSLLPSRVAQRSPADVINLDWVSVNGGGATELAAGDIRLGVTIAQPVAGEVSAGDVKMGLGFWYGAGTGGSCACPNQAEYDNDGFPTALDLGWMIDIVFGGVPEVHDPGCPVSRGDFDFDGFPTALDVAWMIDYVFGGGPEPCDPCNPVQASCAQ